MIRIFKYFGLTFLLICTLFLIFCIGLALFDKEEFYTNGDKKVKFVSNKWYGYSENDNKWEEYKDIEKINDNLWVVNKSLYLKRYEDKITFKSNKEELSILGKDVVITLYRKD